MQLWRSGQNVLGADDSSQCGRAPGRFMLSRRFAAMSGASVPGSGMWSYRRPVPPIFSDALSKQEFSHLGSGFHVGYDCRLAARFDLGEKQGEPGIDQLIGLRRHLGEVYGQLMPPHVLHLWQVQTQPLPPRRENHRRSSPGGCCPPANPCERPRRRRETPDGSSPC